MSDGPCEYEVDVIALIREETSEEDLERLAMLLASDIDDNGIAKRDIRAGETVVMSLKGYQSIVSRWESERHGR